MASDAERLALERWRLILGRFADDALPGCLGGAAAHQDRLLEHLYRREYAGRGVRGADGADRDQKSGGGEASRLSVPEWIREVRELFPASTCEVIARHALERYGLTELVTDAATLEKLEPSYELLKAVLSLRGLMPEAVLAAARRVVAKVVDEIRRRLEPGMRQAFGARVRRHARGRQRIARNLDVRATIRANLKRYDPERRRLIAAELRFFSRVERRLPREVVIAVDSSASMADSVIHAAVTAEILARLPALRVRLIAFDTAVVDLSDFAQDAVEVLMSVQLGGGTDIARALAYAASLIEQPTRAALVVVTDFHEGGDPRALESLVKQLAGAGTRVLGLAALDDKAKPSYDRAQAERLADCGAEIAAMTPEHLAAWLAGAMG